MEDMNSATNKTSINHIPQFSGVAPYLYLSNASAAIEFYKKAFDAKELICLRDEKDKVAHCELEIGKAHFMLSDEYPNANCYSPVSLGGTSAGFTLFFEDAQAVFKNALEAGAKEVRPVEKQFCGDIEGKIIDPFGHQWFIASHVEDVPYDEQRKRAREQMGLH